MRVHLLSCCNVVTSIVVACLSLSAQTSPLLEVAEKADFSSSANAVLLDISVKDRKGGFVSGLKQEHFTISEDGRPKPIASFFNQDVPVTVGLVVDNSGSMSRKRPEVVTAALAFVAQSLRQDEVFVVNFNDRVTMGLPPSVPFTDDAAMLREALLRNKVEGRTTLYDAMLVAIAHLRKGRQAKKTLIVISDGGDNSSKSTLRDVLHELESDTVTVYAIGIFDKDEIDRNPGVLRKFAASTGGEAYFPPSLADLVPTCSRIARDIRARYTISFIPRMTEDGRFHRLQVVVRSPDGRRCEVHTRTGYLAPKKAGLPERDGK